MRVLGLDLETTGLDVGCHEILEIGAVLWDVERRQPLSVLSDLVRVSEPLTAEIRALTGITDEDLEEFGRPLPEVLARVHDLARHADFLVAHNAHQFDRLFFEREWVKHPESKIHLDWIDTATDLPLPASIATRKLSYLAAEHGFLNPFAHRAVFDVLTMLRIFAYYSIEDILRLKESPLRRVVAQVAYENRDQARSEGFRWDPKNRTWYMEGKEIVLKERRFPFPVVWL